MWSRFAFRKGGYQVNKSVRGFALISTLLFLGILFMMSLSIVVMSRHRVFSGLTQHHKSQALYLAEAGLALSQVALEADLKWPGEPNGKVDGIPGTYEVHFGTDRNGSVNNIGKDTAADSYRGTDTVPKNTALLIVTANVSGQTYTLEALVDGKGSTGYMTDAILASGRIRAKGDLKVDGIAALNDAKEVDGSMQSNDKGGSDTVVWEGGGSADITGNVGTGGALSGINMPGANIKAGLEANAPANIPHTDIEKEVMDNSAHPSPVIVPLGTSTINGGKYSAKDLDVQGDLVLSDGATLYIDGSLKVNGSIRGKGTIYVTGETVFRGDSQVTTNPDFSVALYSKGDVSLRGFDGTAFLSSLGATAELQIAETALALLGKEIGSIKSNASNEFWTALEALGEHNGNSPFGPNTGNSLGKLASKVATLPDSETQAFMFDRLTHLEEMFTSPDRFVNTSIENAETKAKLGFEAGETRGIIDAFANTGSVEDKNSAINAVRQSSFDKIGSSYFLGAIYTQGRFVAENEVTIVGALMADAPTGGPEEYVELSDGSKIKMRPGDIYLGNRTSVTYVEEMFKDDEDISYTGPQLLEKNIWMGR